MKHILLVLFCWYAKAFSDAIRFGKGGEDCFELWHIVEWLRFWLIAFAYMYVVQMSFWNIVIVLGCSLGFNTVYKLFRALNVYQWDSRYRIHWLGALLNRKGII